MNRIRSRLRAGGASTDADATAWATAVTANSGTYSAATLTAVDTFVKAAKASGYWTKLNRINLFAGDQLAAALVPLKAGGGSAKDTAVNFVSGDYSEATGLTGNGSTKYLKTGLIPSDSLTLDDTHMAIYNRSSTLGSRADMGAGPSYYINATFTDGKLYQQMGTALISGVLTPPYGLLVASRTAADAQAAYQNGASVGSNTAVSAALPGTEYYACAANNGSDVATSYSTAPISAYSIGLSLTADDATAYAADMEAFQDALGRGVA